MKGPGHGPGPPRFARREASHPGREGQGALPGWITDAPLKAQNVQNQPLLPHLGSWAGWKAGSGTIWARAQMVPRRGMWAGARSYVPWATAPTLSATRLGWAERRRVGLPGVQPLSDTRASSEGDLRGGCATPARHAHHGTGAVGDEPSNYISQGAGPWARPASRYVPPYLPGAIQHPAPSRVHHAASSRWAGYPVLYTAAPCRASARGRLLGSILRFSLGGGAWRLHFADSCVLDAELRALTRAALPTHKYIKIG